ncbi:hypothetical protein PENTCL1PPCAC_23096, partial [Pristionchus entomophagus]
MSEKDTNKIIEIILILALPVLLHAEMNCPCTLLSSKFGVIVLCLSVRSEANVKHFVIHTDENEQLFIDSSHKEDNVSDLINFYENTHNPVIPSSNIKLKRGIRRQPWSFNHYEIYIVMKLADGFFGETWLAKFICERRPFMDQQAVV